jgi:hypothetical protein
MKRFIAILALFLAIAPPLAAAQTAQSLADVAKAEEARRKSVKKPAKTYGNANLKPDPGPGTTTSSTPADPATGTTPTPGVPAVEIALSPDPAAEAEQPPAQGEKFWTGRMTEARAALARSQMFADALQSRINALNTDFVNRDDPAQRAVIGQDRDKALAELERVKKEITAQTKAIADIQEEARKAGVPAAWVR